MPLPSDVFVSMFTPWLPDSPDLEALVRTFGECFDPYHIYISDQDDGTVGYSAMLDVDLLPDEGLPWLAQWVGERLTPGQDAASSRQQIRAMPNQLRGTKIGIAREAMKSLTGSRTVMMHPRSQLDGTEHDDYLTVLTLPSETATPDVTRAAILSKMPADIVLNYDTPSETIWSTVATLGTWADVEVDSSTGHHRTWADVSNLLPTATGGWYVYTVDDMDTPV